VALARTSRGSKTIFNSFNPTGAIVSDAFTPSSSSLLAVCFGCVVFGTPASGNFTDLTISNTGGWTFTARTGFKPTSPDFGEYWTLIRIWTAPITTGASMTVTCDLPGTDDFAGACLGLADYTGYDTGSPVGATAAEDLVDDGADSATLSGAPASTSEIFGGRMAGVTGAGGNISASPGASHTELYDLPISDVGGLQVQVRDPGSTSTAFSWADVDVGAGTGYDIIGAAIEIKEAAAAGAAFPIPRLSRQLRALLTR
jgi:hypothetical protein